MLLIQPLQSLLPMREKLMDQIRAAMQAFTTAEEELLKARNEQFAAAQATTRFPPGHGSIVGSRLLVLSILVPQQAAKGAQRPRQKN
jgi:CHASE3 domain sensor protein